MTEPVSIAQGQPTLWQRMCRFNLTKSRRTRRRLAAFCAEFASSQRTLVVHSPDVDYQRYFPDTFVVASKGKKHIDLQADKYYQTLAQIDDSSFGQVLCTGLLEHVPDPPRLIEQFHRILRPGGRLIISASAVFTFHGSPDNFFHFTGDGFGHLFREWSRIETIRGSTRPFETIGVLMQRINMQCDVFPPVRLLIEAMMHTIPLLDFFVVREYPSRSRVQPGSLMPATLHAVVVK